MTPAEWKFFGLLLLIALVSGLIERFTKTTRRKSSTKKKSKKTPSSTGRQSGRRSDDVILKTRLDDLTWSEFERLLALYFRDQGYKVEETGVGGNDGGVDLVLVDKQTNERTAVQIKWRSDAPIGPNVVRELNTAKRNANCLYTMLITNSDITPGAKNEAEQLRMDCWNGPRLQFRLSKWDKWNPPKKRRRTRSTSSV